MKVLVLLIWGLQIGDCRALFPAPVLFFLFFYVSVTPRDPEKTCPHWPLVLLGRKIIFSSSELKILWTWKYHIESRIGASSLNRHRAGLGLRMVALSGVLAWKVRRKRFLHSG